MKTRFLWALGLVLVLWIVYRPSFGASFHLDDWERIVFNQDVKDLPQYLKQISWRTPRFIAYLTLGLNYLVSGDKVTSYHLVNWLIHFINTMLVWGLSEKLLSLISGFKARKRRGISWLIALIFGIHPIQTQAVIYIVQRMVLLATFFYLSGLITYIKGRETKNWGWFGLTLSCLILGFYAKEMVATLPFIILSLEGLIFQRGKTKQLKFLVVPLAAVVILVFLGFKEFSLPYLSQSQPMYDGTQIEQKSYAITQIPVFATYLRLLILPVRQNLDYDYPVFKTLFNFRVLMGLLLLIAYGYLIGKNYRRNPLIVFGLIWIPLSLLVESSVIVIKDVIFEHRLYLPMVGFAIVCVLIVERAISDKSLQSIFFLVGLWAIILGYLTYQRSRVWQSEVSLWQDVVAKSPKKARGYDYLGVAYQLQGQYELGFLMHQQAIKLNSLYGEPYHNAGSALIALKRYEEAEAYYRKAIEKDPKQAYFYQGLGQALLKQNKFAEAREALNKSLELLPGYVKAVGSLKELQELESKSK